MRSILGLCWFRGCKGLQPSRSGTTIGTFDQDLEGAGPSAAVLGDASFVLPQQGMRSILGLCCFRGCKGLQPSRSGTTIGAFDQDLEGAGPSAAGLDRCKLCFAAARHAFNLGPLLVPRLQGTAALQVRNDYWGFDQDLEGARSVGAVGNDEHPAPVLHSYLICVRAASAKLVRDTRSEQRRKSANRPRSRGAPGIVRDSGEDARLTLWRGRPRPRSGVWTFSPRNQC